MYLVLLNNTYLQISMIQPQFGAKSCKIIIFCQYIYSIMSKRPWTIVYWKKKGHVVELSSLLSFSTFVFSLNFNHIFVHNSMLQMVQISLPKISTYKVPKNIAITQIMMKRKFLTGSTLFYLISIFNHNLVHFSKKKYVEQIDNGPIYVPAKYFIIRSKNDAIIQKTSFQSFF